MKQKGFTLIEIMIVLGIIGLLVAIILPKLPEALLTIIIGILVWGLIVGTIVVGATLLCIYIAPDKNPSQLVYSQIKRAYNYIINAFFRETQPPKQGDD